MTTIMVRCTFTIPVEVPDDPDYDAGFDIDENHCPGTGRVGAALDAVMAKHAAASTCWACTLNGVCKIVESRELSREWIAKVLGTPEEP